jgi:hypothetical protein
MLYPHKKLDVIVQEMKSFGTFLMAYNHPRVPQKDEEEVNFIKTRDVYVDGYNVILHYNKADYGTHYLETLQVLSKYSPFLPFSLVCKIGKKFFGESNLSLVEVFKDNRKVYCWTKITDAEGNAVVGQIEQEARSYEGFSFRLMNPKSVNFY